jgi:hypothetical protein
MTNEELESAIKTVMMFDGWFNRKSENGIIYWSKEGQYITRETQLVERTYYHNSWEWLHPVWEKFRDMSKEIALKYDEKTYNTHAYVYCNGIRKAITDGTKMEAFTALYEGIVWFNSLNKEG